MDIDSVKALQAELQLLRRENLRLKSSGLEHDPLKPEIDAFAQPPTLPSEGMFDRAFSSVADCLGEGLLLVDLNDVIVYVNHRMVELTGYRADELLGRRAAERLLTAGQNSAFVKYLPQDREIDSAPHELEIHRKDRTTFTSETRATPWRDAQGVVIGTVATIIDISARRRALAALQESEARYRQIFERNTAIKLLIDPHTMKILDANGAACEFYGYSLETMQGMNLSRLNTLPPDDLKQELRRAVEGTRHLFNFRHRLASGIVREVEIHTGPVDFGGRACLFSIVHDVTARKRLQEQLLLGRKLESVARLAGGIAHDFNNLLTAILGYTSLAQTETKRGSEMDTFHKNIQKAAESASDLTLELLAFARRTALQPKQLDVRVHLLQIQGSLRQLLRDDIEMVIAPAGDLRDIYVDPSMIDQVLDKLVENARDALPYGGRILISAANVIVSEQEAREKGAAPAGEYVQILVEDNGIGMSDDIITRIFDPFFTIKPQGQGRGLGLALCYGLVSQSAGTIRVESTQGAGTRFTILFPVSQQEESSNTEVEGALEAAAAPPQAIKRKTILLVEDDALVRALAARGLQERGYHVLEAGQGREALEVADAYEGAIDLVVADVIMPRMGGKELMAHLHKRRPDIQVLYISGYIDNAIVRHGILEPGLPFLQKPFTADALARWVDALLPEPNGSAP